MHGTFCGMIYKIRYGKQLVYNYPQPESKEEIIIQNAIWEIQDYQYKQTKMRVEDMQRIANEYPATKKMVQRAFDSFRSVLGYNHGNLIRAITYWFINKRLPPELELFADRLPDEYKQSETRA